jgi:tetratricopeptide (TPR) repeat protein
MRVIRTTLLLAALLASVGPAAAGWAAFQHGAQLYVAGDFERAAAAFREAAETAPAAGTLHNLGNAEWKCGRPGPAILAWEQAQWLDPRQANTRANLRFARRAGQLEPPALAWHEICSTWLPVDAWAWLAGGSLWIAVGALLLPGILRWRRADWNQALAAASFAVFLLTLPALAGVQSRTALGVVLQKQTPLRLTPTREAQILGQLPAGEMARLGRERGDYVYVRTGNDAAGWVERGQFGRVCER